MQHIGLHMHKYFKWLLSFFLNLLKIDKQVQLLYINIGQDMTVLHFLKIL